MVSPIGPDRIHRHFPTIPLYRGQSPSLGAGLQALVRCRIFLPALIIFSPMCCVHRIIIKTGSHGPVFYLSNPLAKKRPRLPLHQSSARWSRNAERAAGLILADMNERRWLTLQSHRLIPASQGSGIFCASIRWTVSGSFSTFCAGEMMFGPAASLSAAKCASTS